ncbi:MAG: hypothetical protein J1E81_04420 [Eubacterium sp.]|nr:hypothetical protein [Eubacterium sp.]
MATFVGAEYIIANVLIALKKFSNRDMVTLDELSEAGIFIQQQSLSDDKIDAIFLSSSEQVVTALYDFSDYFEYDRKTNSIRIVKTKNIQDLESRFIGYLPFNVLSFLVNITMKFVQQG